MEKRVNLIIVLAFFCAHLVFGQSSKINLPEEYRKISMLHEKTTESAPAVNRGNNVTSSSIPLRSIEEQDIGETYYDLQTNSCTQNRYVVYPDGYRGGTWTYGMNNPSFPDRGTGYNNYDGNNWDPFPTERIESVRNGWPSYDKWDENGEIVVSHSGSNSGLIISTRAQKGTGTWNETFLPGPEDHEDLLWPRMITAGENNQAIHILALTPPVENMGSPYQGLNGALLYYRSIDGGQTWEDEHRLLEGISADYYTGFSGDTYTWIDSEGDNIAFLLGNEWTDFILMKSNDGGLTWEKTVIWNHPYPMFDLNNPIQTDTFYCNDGAFHGAFDSNGEVHVTFGITRTYSDGTSYGTYWFPFIDGLAYWNENDEQFNSEGDNLNALSPFDDPGSQLEIGDNLIGWVPDINGNGTWVEDLVCIYGDCIGAYYIGASSMPQLVIDNFNVIHVFFSAVCEVRDNNSQNYRQLFYTSSENNGNTWPTDDIEWITENPVHTFDECVFPSVSPYVEGNKIHLIYQRDSEPGLAVKGDLDPYTLNTITALEKSLPFYLTPPQNLQAEVTGDEVSLTWESPIEENLLGYNVYRDNEKLNEEPVSEEYYIDDNLEVGTYLYGVTAVYNVGESGQETIEVTIQFPIHFDFEGGNPLDPVWTLYLSTATLDELSLQPNDEIAIFDGDTLVGAYVLDEVLTPEDQFEHFLTAFSTLTYGNGYDPGNPITLKCWDASEQEESGSFEVSFSDPYGDAWTEPYFPENDGEFSIVDLEFNTSVIQTYSLNEGFQFVSSYIEPFEPNMLDVNSEILEDLDFIRNTEGSMLRKIGPNWINNIGDWVTTEGYLYRMNNPSNALAIEGLAIDPVTPIELAQGFQIISYMADYPVDALVAVESILDNLDFMRNTEGSMLRKIGPNWINNIGNLMPGEGYLMRMNADDELIYNLSPVKSHKVKAYPNNIDFQGGNPADPVYSIYLEPENGIELGDEIAAFDGDKLVGAVKITSGNWQDNELATFSTLTTGKGYNSGNQLSLKVMTENGFSDLNYELSGAWESRSVNTYPKGDGAYSIAKIHKMNVGMEDIFGISVYPIPAKNYLNIASQEDIIQLRLMNSFGQDIIQKSIFDHQIKLDISNLNSGIYILEIELVDKLLTKKIVIK
ncbi:MAG: T9SS type A sorting domain-containing protein [Bacteroidales bacterium]|nr:T9SS type A sorting domain-containing protein [Bacteroidales bacterium]